MINSGSSVTLDLGGLASIEVRFARRKISVTLIGCLRPPVFTSVTPRPPMRAYSTAKALNPRQVLQLTNFTVCQVGIETEITYHIHDSISNVRRSAPRDPDLFSVTDVYRFEALMGMEGRELGYNATATCGAAYSMFGEHTCGPPAQLGERRNVIVIRLVHQPWNSDRRTSPHQTKSSRPVFPVLE